MDKHQTTEEQRQEKVRQLAWETFKQKGFTIFDGPEPMKDDDHFCFYEQGFSDAFEHIFKTSDYLKLHLNLNP
jgi:hypothetical protein